MPRCPALPTVFWQTLTDSEAKDLFESDGELKGEVLKRAWRMMEMQGPPPKRMKMYFNADEFEQVLKDEKR